MQSIVAYWFYLRFKTDSNSLGGIFFGRFSLCPVISCRSRDRPPIRVIKRDGFTHLPSNFLLSFVPLMPTLELAVIMLLVRNSLSQLDVPTRQSYTMAVVDADERAASAGILSVARNAGAAVAPLFTGAILAVPTLGLPFLLRRIKDNLRSVDFRGVSPCQTAGGKSATSNGNIKVIVGRVHLSLDIGILTVNYRMTSCRAALMPQHAGRIRPDLCSSNSGKMYLSPNFRDKPRANYERQPTGIGTESVRERTGRTDTCGFAPPPRLFDLLERVSPVLSGEPIHHGRDGLADFRADQLAA